MFEHSLYEPETVAPPTGEGDFLHDYEIKNWELGPRVYKIIGISAIANILALLIVAQTSLLTMKGCDSPLVGGVCKVLDTVYIGAMLFGTEREDVDQVYEKTELADADITFVDVTGVTPPLSYPEGYFQIANPEQHQAMLAALNDPLAMGTVDDTGIPITPPSITGGSLLDTHTPSLPSPTNKPVEGDLPSFGGSSGVASNPRPRRQRRPAVTPQKPDEDDVVADATKDPAANNANTAEQPKVDPTPVDADAAAADRFGVFINKRPIRDEAVDTLEKVDTNQIKLETPFHVTIAGTLALAKDGNTIILKDPKPVPPPPGMRNDPAMEKFVQEWILAVSDTGWLGYLDVIDKKKIKNKRVLVTVQQNDTEFVARIRSEVTDENTAATQASGLGTILSIASTQTDGDEQVFLKAARTSSEGKYVILDFNMPKQQVQEMIQRKLAAEKSQPKQPNGTAPVHTRDASAKK